MFKKIIRIVVPAVLFCLASLAFAQESNATPVPATRPATPAASASPAPTINPAIEATPATATGSVPSASATPAAETRDVVVSASRQAESASTAAANVTVIDAAQIAASGASTVPEVLAILGGVQFRSEGSAAKSQVTMRGFGDNSFGRVLVLVDGFRLNNPDMKGINWLSIPLGDIEKIEVLHGAASALYGDSAVAGVISITRKSTASGMSASAALGSGWTNQESFRLSRKADGVGFSLGAQNYGTEGSRDRSAYRSSSIESRLDLALGDKMDLRLGGDYSDIAYEMPGALSRAQFDADPTQAVNQADEARQKDADGRLSWQWRAADWLTLDLPVDYRFSQVENDMTSWTSFQTRTTNVVESRPQASLGFDLGGPLLDVLGGFDFRYTNLAWTNFTAADRQTALADRAVSQTIAAPWLRTSLDISGLVVVNAGLRYDTASYELNSTQKNLDALVWSASAAFVPVEGFKLWASANRVFRYPFTDEMASVMSSTVWDLRPEQGYNFEAGLGLGLGKGLLDLDAGFYSLSLDDEIAWVDDWSNVVDFGANVNLDATQRYGLDVSLASKPVDFIQLRGSWHFVDARFAEGANLGKEVPLVSAHRVDGQISFLIPGGISFGPRASWTSGYWAGGDSANAGSLEPDSFLLGADLRLDLALKTGILGIQVTADNILDAKYSSLTYTYPWADYLYPGQGFALKVLLDWKY